MSVNDHLCNDETVIFSQRILLGEIVMDDIVRAIEIYSNAEK